MANQEHLDILRQGVEVWNKWRPLYEGHLLFPQPDLSGANLQRINLKSADLQHVDLQHADLSGADLQEANLTGANLKGAELEQAHLEKANLQGACLSRANLLKAEIRVAYLMGADLYEANLTAADLSGSDLTRACFVLAELNEANLRNVNLSDADLRISALFDTDLSRSNLKNVDFSFSHIYATRFLRSNLSNANFSQAILSGADFGDVNLSDVIGLERARHSGPSSIGIDTIYRSKGKIPEKFLRGAGVPDEFIIYMKSLVNNPIEYYSCFISYSNKDQNFAERIYADLQNKSVRCWYAPEDIKIGDKIRDSIDASIRYHDKLLLVLSENSVQSQWVEHEVEAALEREQRENRLVLFPVTLDSAVMDTNKAWAANIRRSRHIGDFRKWKNHDDYQRAFDRVLRDLKQSTKEL